jgi:hypothetical protein
MTVGINAVATLEFPGTGTTHEFSVAFPTFENANVEVFIGYPTTTSYLTHTIVQLNINTDYTLSRIGIQNQNATLTLVDSGQMWISAGKLAVGYTMFVKFTTKPVQPARISGMGLETVVDRHTMNINALRDEMLRCVKFTDYSYLVEGKRLTAEELLWRLIVLEDVMNVLTGNDSGYAYNGWSARFSEFFSSTGLSDTLEKILMLSYQAPSVSLSATGSGTLREKGNTVTNPTLTASVTKKTDLIAKIEFFYNNVLVAGGTYEPPSNTGSGITNHAWTGSFTDNVTFKVEVTDDGTQGGPTTVSSTVTYSFVYPYYYGAGPAGKTPAQVAALTKDVVASTATKSVTFTTADSDVYYFAYPASYGALTQILDISNFDTLSDWTLTTADITGLDGNPVSYRIYEFNNPVVAGLTTYIFKR